MIRTRVIPVVLLDSYSVVKTINFDIRRNLGNPVVVARVYNNRNVDELILLDIDATREGRSIDLKTVEFVAYECFMPLTVGGGIKTAEDVSRVLKAGADKVCLNSVFFSNKEIFKQLIDIFGRQCIIASLDVKKDANGTYVLFTNAGFEKGVELKEAIQFFNKVQVGEILINNVDEDGKMQGYDYGLISFVAGLTDIPIIAVGGASCPEDCAKAVRAGANAVGIASIFHFTNFTPQDCKRAMALEGIPVRL